MGQSKVLCIAVITGLSYLSLFLLKCLSVFHAAVAASAHCCATEIHESHCVTLEWQVGKVINILTQWWPALSVIKCHLQEKCRCFRQEKGESCHTVCAFDEAAKINLQFLQLKARAKNKEHLRLRWTQDICSPHFLLHVSEMNHFTLERQNQISVYVRKENSLYSVIILLQYAGCGSHFLLFVPFPSKGLIWSSRSQGASQSLGISDLALFLLTEIQVSAELPLMASKGKGERLRARQDDHKEKN